HVLKVASQLLLLEQLLGVVDIVTNALVFYAVHKREPLGSIDGLCRQVNKLLGVAFKVVQPTAARQYAYETTPSELRFVLKISQEIRQLDVCFFEQNRRGENRLSGEHATATDCKVGLADLHSRLRHRRAVLNCPSTVADELFVIELHSICCLVLDPIPERPKFLTVQDSLTRLYGPSLVSVLDVEFACELPQDLGHLRQMRCELLRQLQCAVFQCRPEVVLDLTLGIHIRRGPQVGPNGFRLVNP